MKIIIGILAVCLSTAAEQASEQSGPAIRWQAPFDTTLRTAVEDSVFTLDKALLLAAKESPALKALEYRKLASIGQLEQTKRWSNPELEAGVEEFSWNAPGLSSSEYTIALSQEFEFFGQRGARQKAARSELKATEFESNVAAFDLYLEVKRRFYELAHAQEELRLAKSSVQLADEIVDNISFRIERGAGLQSELLLAQIEQQRTRLRLEELEQQREAASTRLVALWNGRPGTMEVSAENEPDLQQLLARDDLLQEFADSTRTLRLLQNQVNVLRAQQSLAAVESKPTITISGGFKHLATDNSNSLLLGLAMPLPLFNRNQGDRASIRAQTRSIEYEIEQERLDVTAALRSHVLSLRSMVRRHEILDTQLLPKAEQAYRSLQEVYESGRLPYTQLLEAERSLVELRFEHNDVLLSLHEQIIELESLTGVVLKSDKEK